jgi:hypothetical protein
LVDPQTHIRRLLQTLFIDKHQAMLRYKDAFNADFNFDNPPPGGYRLSYIIERMRYGLAPSPPSLSPSIPLLAWASSVCVSPCEQRLIPTRRFGDD